MTSTEIAALAVQVNPFFDKASDNGVCYFIAVGDSGEDAIPFNEASGSGGYVTVSTTQTLDSGSLGKIVLATGADLTLTLPPLTSGDAGVSLTVVVDRGFSGFATISSASSINGSTTRKMHHGEWAKLRWTGSTWTKESGVSIPLQAAIYHISTQAISLDVNTPTKLTLSSLGYDNLGTIANTGSSSLTIRRTGRYAIRGYVPSNVLVENVARFYSLVRNITAGFQVAYDERSGQVGSFPSPLAFIDWQPHTDGDVLELWAACSCTVPLNTSANGASVVQLSLVEIPAW